MIPPLPLGERATRTTVAGDGKYSQDIVSPSLQLLIGAGTDREKPQPAETYDIDDALTGGIEPNLWNGFGTLSMTRRTELAAQAITATAVLLLFAAGALAARHQSEHQVSDAPVAAQAGTMIAGLFWLLLLVPATFAAVWFAAKFALHVIAERHEIQVAQEKRTEQEDEPEQGAAPDAYCRTTAEPQWRRPPNAT